MILNVGGGRRTKISQNETVTVRSSEMSREGMETFGNGKIDLIKGMVVIRYI